MKCENCKEKFPKDYTWKFINAKQVCEYCFERLKKRQTENSLGKKYAFWLSLNNSSKNNKKSSQNGSKRK